MDFVRKLLNFSKGSSKSQPADARGSAPVQSQEDQDATRSRMEAEMTQQRERRASQHTEQ
jgi:hypothetical protein